jgi:hypothetical protein
MRHRILFFAASILAVIPALAACGDEEGGGTTAGTASPGASASPAASATQPATGARSPARATVTPTPTQTPVQTPTPAPTGTAGGDFAALIKDLDTRSVQVTYDFQNGEQKLVLVQSQRPPKRAIDILTVADGRRLLSIDDGTTVYLCEKTNSTAEGACLKQATGGAQQPLLIDLNGIARGGATSADLKEVAGRTIAGRAARCFEGTFGRQTGQFCADRELGVALFYETESKDGKLTMTATKFETNPPDSTFEPPYRSLN